MRLQFVTIGQNLKRPRGGLSFARKKHRREIKTLALARVIRFFAKTWTAEKGGGGPGARLPQ